MHAQMYPYRAPTAAASVHHPRVHEGAAPTQRALTRGSPALSTSLLAQDSDQRHERREPEERGEPADEDHHPLLGVGGDRLGVSDVLGSLDLRGVGFLPGSSRLGLRLLSDGFGFARLRVCRVGENLSL